MKINWRSTLQTTLALILMVLGVIFFARNRNEIKDVALAFRDAEPTYLLFALIALIVIISAQAVVIRLIYKSIEKDIPLRETVPLYLKRFFISPFIPGGFSMAQYTMTKDLKHHDLKTSEHAFASSAYVVASIGSYLILLVPVVLLASKSFFTGLDLIYLIARVVSIAVIIVALVGFIFRPYFSRVLREWLKPHIGHFHSVPLIQAGLTSLIVDIAGITILWSAVRSLGMTLPLEIIAGAYILTLVVLMLAPLFQGLFVVEGILTYFLVQAGLPSGVAFASTLIFRGFQLWLPLLAGGVVYVWPLWHRARERFGADI